MIFDFLSTDLVLSKLSRDLKKTRKAAYAAGTQKNHRTQWRSYLYFCLHFDLVFLPASIRTISLYCQFLSRSMTPPSIRNYLSGVKLLHVSLGYPFPDLSTHEIQVTLRGIDRLAQHCPLRAPPNYTPFVRCSSQLWFSSRPYRCHLFLRICVCLFPFRTHF